MGTGAELHDLQDVEELDDEYFAAVLEDHLPLAWPAGAQALGRTAPA